MPFVTDVKDTVSTDKQDDEVDRNQDARDDRPAVGHNAVVHDVGPLLSCEDLTEVKKQKQFRYLYILISMTCGKGVKHSF